MICLTWEILAAKANSGIIENLKKEDNVIILIRKKEYDKNWQHPEKVTDYIIENYEYVGEIAIYEAYM